MYVFTQEDFVAIEMVNRKIRFVWDVGGGIGEITHPMHIQTASDLNNDQHWYRIEAERVHNVGKLSIRPQVVPNGSSLAMGSPHTNTSTAGTGRLDISPDDQIWIGGIDKAPLPPYLHSRQHGLVGCLHQAWLDGRPVGLWNFKSQPSGTCSACIEGYVLHLFSGVALDDDAKGRRRIRVGSPCINNPAVLKIQTARK